MAKYLVQITDYSSNQFSLMITVPVLAKPSWRTTDMSWIRYQHGPGVIVDKSKSNPFTGDSDLDAWTRHKHLYLSNGANSGLILYEFLGWTDANDSGSGFLVPSWAVGADSGSLSWAVTG